MVLYRWVLFRKHAVVESATRRASARMSACHSRTIGGAARAFPEELIVRSSLVAGGRRVGGESINRSTVCTCELGGRRPGQWQYRVGRRSREVSDLVDPGRGRSQPIGGDRELRRHRWNSSSSGVRLIPLIDGTRTGSCSCNGGSAAPPVERSSGRQGSAEIWREGSDGIFLAQPKAKTGGATGHGSKPGSVERA